MRLKAKCDTRKTLLIIYPVIKRIIKNGFRQIKIRNKILLLCDIQYKKTLEKSDYTVKNICQKCILFLVVFYIYSIFISFPIT